MAKSLTYTVTMDANLARVVGVPAAMLYNLIAWLSDTEWARDYDPDGWIYMTADFYSDRTSFHFNTFTAAAKALEKEGLIERCRKFKKGTSISVNHFRLLARENDSQFTGNVSGIHSKCELNIYKRKNKINSRNHENRDLLRTSEPSASGASQATPARTAPMEDESVFGEEITNVSVRPVESERARENRRAFAMLKSLRQRRGLKGNGGVVEKQRVAALINDGWTEDELVDLLNWEDNDEFYADKPLATRLCNDAVEKYQAYKNNKIEMAPQEGEFLPLTWENEDD